MRARRVYRIKKDVSMTFFSIDVLTFFSTRPILVGVWCRATGRKKAKAADANPGKVRQRP
jgi:hypothetical protein